MNVKKDKFVTIDVAKDSIKAMVALDWVFVGAYLDLDHTNFVKDSSKVYLGSEFRSCGLRLMFKDFFHRQATNHQEEIPSHFSF